MATTLNGFLQATSAPGISGALLYTYQAGTGGTVLQDAYSDNALTVPHANPIVADANGYFPTIYLGTVEYFIRMTTPGGVTIQEIDWYGGGGIGDGGGGASEVDFPTLNISGNYTVLDANRANFIIANPGGGALTINADSAARTAGFPFFVTNDDNTGGSVTILPGGGQTIGGLASVTLSAFRQTIGFTSRGAAGWSILFQSLGNPTSDFSMANFKIVALADGTALTHAATVGQEQSGITSVATGVTNTSDAIRVTFTPARTTWVTRSKFTFTPIATNLTTAPTISWDAGASTRVIKKGNSQPLVAGDLLLGHPADVYYNGTDCILLNPATHTGDTRNSANNTMTGVNTMSGSNVITVAESTTASRAASVGQVQSGAVQRATVVGGTFDAIVLTHSPTRTAITGQVFSFASAGPNTITGVTIQSDATAADTVRKHNNVVLAVGDTGPAGYEVQCRHNGTHYIILNPYTDTVTSMLANELASTTAVGFVELATSVETLTGTDTTRGVTPGTLAAVIGNGASIASAGVITIGDGDYHVVTGTTTITDIDFTTTTAGLRKAWIRFAGVLTLTHNATNLILLGGANIETAAGDMALFVSEGGDIVRMVSYHRANPVLEFDLGLLSQAAGFSTAHGLPASPDFVTFELRCNTIDQGFAVGDKIPVDSGFASNNTGISPFWNATNVGWRNGGTFAVSSAGGGTTVALTGARWDVYAKIPLYP